MKKIRNLVLLFAMIMVLGGVNIYAANVGDKLEQPEDGWKRYDDADTNIKYNGTWIKANDSSLWEKSFMWSKDYDASINFKFKGTKLRIISKLWNERSNNIQITVDGQSQHYSEYYDGAKFQVLVYEKLNLQDTIHEVKILNLSPGQFSLDAIDMNEDGKLVNQNQLEAPINLTATPSTNAIILNWDAVGDAKSYTILRSTTSDSIDTIIDSNVTDTTYIDNDVEPGVTYYYVVRAVKNGIESTDSNIASAMIEKVNPAVLQIKLSTTDIYEYRITMNEVKDFIKWYTDRSNGTGLPFYKFKTVDSNIEPYTDSIEYLIFDKIVWFKVKEYTK
ncbi:MAG: hypothetical protein N4A63_08815 [Vallitalea sp.]|jgi:hypothetical protein|nr:hypothetical protein [Vallitalea sp.]